LAVCSRITGLLILYCMRTLYLFLVALLLQQTAAAQKRSPIDQQITTRYYQGAWFAKLNIASMLDPLTPTLQPGIEYKISRRLSTEVLFGIPVIGHNHSQVTDSTYYRYYKVKGELRFYPADRFFYVGPQLFFTNRRQSKYDGVVRGQDGRDYQYRYAELNRNIFGFIFKAGRIFPLSEKWNIDGSFGFGPRLVDLKLNATSLNQTQNFVGSMWERKDRIGTYVGIHVEITAKLSYQLF